MRIAVVAHSATRAGGVETYLSNLIPALLARGHDVACWFEGAAEGHEPVVASSSNVPVWIAAADAADALGSLRDWKPDVIYSHGLRAVPIERELTRIAPVAFFAHSYYGACISGEKSTRFPMLSPCDRVFGPACLGHYFPRGCGGLSPLTMLRDYDTQSRKRDLLAEYHGVLVGSAHMSRMYAAQGVEARVVPLPAAAAALRPSVTRRPGAPWNLLFLGRLERSKGVSVALHASARAARMLEASVRLVVAGRGSQAETLRREAAALVSRNARLSVEFPGWLTDDGRASALREADVLLVPSLWPEPFGLVGVEAATAGVPAIAFDVGGIADWLHDGVNGRLIALDADRVRRFAEGIVRTLGDTAGLQRLKEQARSVAERFTMTQHVRELERSLQQAVERARPGLSITRTA